MALDSLAGQLDCVPAKGHGRSITLSGRAEGGASEAIAMVEGRHSTALSVATPGVAGVYTFSIRNRGGLRIMDAKATLIGDVAKLAQVTAINEAAGTITVAVVDFAAGASTATAAEFIGLTVVLDSL